jgi:hypothetical protein
MKIKSISIGPCGLEIFTTRLLTNKQRTEVKMSLGIEDSDEVHFFISEKE